MVSGIGTDPAAETWQRNPDDGSGVRQRMWWRGVTARLALLIAVVACLTVSVLVGPAAHSVEPAGPASAAAPMFPATEPSAKTPAAKAQPAPLNRGAANVRHAPGGQPLAETARAFGSSTLGADATEASDQPLFLSRAWTTRSSGAVRRVLETVAPRLGRAPPSSRVS